MRTLDPTERTLLQMATEPRVRVKAIYAPEGVFVNRTLLEKTRYFLARAATPKKGKRARGEG